MGKKAAPPPLLPRPPACLALFAKDNHDNVDRDNVVTEEAKAIQRRLRELLTQVWDENATFQRIMYKNRNQHRQTIYFRRLLQVRRDVLLLQSLGISDAVETFVQCVTERKEKAAAAKPSATNVKVEGSDSKERQRITIQRQVLGAARLLQQIADPILNASSGIAALLSQSFFMPFALTMLALLGRFRALLLQVLYEVVAVFNLLAANVKQIQILAGSEDIPVLLECQWDGVKLLVFEKMPPPLPPPSLRQLQFLPASVSDATTLPAIGWFIDDRSTVSKEKSMNFEPGPMLYEREASFLLEPSVFEVLGEEEGDLTLTGSATEHLSTQNISNVFTNGGNSNQTSAKKQAGKLRGRSEEEDGRTPDLKRMKVDDVFYMLLGIGIQALRRLL